jgi:hypothetical protein
MKLRRGKDGLYLGKFRKLDDAKMYVKKLINKYRHSPNPQRTSIRSIVEWAEKDGVTINRQSMARWIREVDTPIRPRPTRRKAYKKATTFTINDKVLEKIDSYPNKSYLAELGLRLVTRMPMQDIILFYPTGVNVIFKHMTGGKIKALTTGKLSVTDKQHLSKLVDLANKKGVSVVKDYAETFNFKYYGGDE